MRNKNIFNLLAILIILSTISDKTYAYPFLTKSKLLKTLGAQILISESHDNYIVFDKSILTEYNVPLDGQDTYLISDDGLVPMAGKTTTKNLHEMCTAPYPGVGYKKTTNTDIFIATGKNLEGTINWYPAKMTNTHNKACFNNQPVKHSIYSSYESIIPKGIVQQARWNRHLTNEEFKANCRSMADWNAKVNQQATSIDDLYEKCLTGNWACRDEERLIVFFMNSVGECNEITNTSIDCYGKAEIGDNLHEFLGTLVIQEKSKQETWLIWNAPGYEGEGVYAIEVNDIGQKEKQSEEWLVYNGC